MDFLEWIDVPVTFGSVRRLLRFRLDRDWLNSLSDNNQSKPEPYSESGRLTGYLDTLRDQARDFAKHRRGSPFTI